MGTKLFNKYKAGTCIHFNGIQYDCCDAGVDYSQNFLDKKLAIPCLPQMAGSALQLGTCALRAEADSPVGARLCVSRARISQ